MVGWRHKADALKVFQTGLVHRLMNAEGLAFRNPIVAFGSILTLVGLALASVSLFNLVRRYFMIAVCNPLPSIITAYEFIFHGGVAGLLAPLQLDLSPTLKDTIVLWSLAAGTVLRVALPIFREVRRWRLDASDRGSLVEPPTYQHRTMPKWTGSWFARPILVASIYLLWPVILIYLWRNNCLIYTRNLGRNTYLWYDVGFLQINSGAVELERTKYDREYSNVERQGSFWVLCNFRWVLLMQVATVAAVAIALLSANRLICGLTGQL